MNGPTQISWLIPAFLLAACAQTGPAEAPKQQAQKHPIKCNIALPYQADQVPDCSPQAAAAYDFAFCSLHYRLTALSLPESKAEALWKKAFVYEKVSEALSSVDTHRHNVAFAKEYYESLRGRDMVTFGVNYTTTKCANIEFHHAEMLRELERELKRQGKVLG